jgi:hypothetical protein
MLAGSLTMSAAIGSAEQAVTQGVVKGASAQQASTMIALSYGITYIWGTVGIILICKYLPRWWGLDARAAAKQYEEEKGVENVDYAGLSGYRTGALRAYKLTNDKIVGWTIKQFVAKYPQYKIVNVRRPALADKPAAKTAARPPAAGTKRRAWMQRRATKAVTACQPRTKPRGRRTIASARRMILCWRPATSSRWVAASRR